MNEYRINYNPFTKEYFSDSQSHTIQIYNKGKQKKFNEYIRGIILDDILYLRLYYPYNNIDTLTKKELYQFSYTLLKENTVDIIKTIKKHEDIIIKEIKYNVINDLLRNLNLTNI